ncbi:sugar-binding domain-containing protein [Lysinibacillus telephonicus]|uniref:Uncharacterized protein n=1 Tax=Lysinibacillus telephonicus TaxID=1714840 RepID=A0A3S0HGL8_9BACI|nr:sugar-binding domain-containing protein [Lysinibacillus telephonicus]RTQ91183.1 hypothetical protein EKG35_13765 [Lysinibacillus telephonicus]
MDKNFASDSVQQLVPELPALLQLRYRILQTISVSGPTGRRAIQDALKITERSVRNETTLLKNQKLIKITTKGMVCTENGFAILEQLKPIFQELSGLAQKEKALAKLLGIEKVVIVPGNLEEDEGIKQLLGKEAVAHLTAIAKKDNTVAITGGSSVASLSNFLTPSKSLNTLSFVAARGSIGDEMKYQANTLVSEFASKCQATFRTLYLPENLSKNAYEAIIKEPVIKEILDLYEKIDIVIHGIGTAKEMAVRRNATSELVQLLEQKHAVGEAFGYYFDELGQIIYRINTIGIQLNQVKKSPKIIAVAGGAFKAKAIQAYFKNAASQTTLITDEGAANAILNG